MIFLNGHLQTFPKFPDGTSAVKVNPDHINKADYTTNRISWFYDSDDELIQLWYLNKHIREVSDQPVDLRMPYIPNARMDRCKEPEDVHTLRYFSDLINAMRFHEVTVLDPHSDVSTALLNRVNLALPDDMIQSVINGLEDYNLLVCYPDNGSAKRYSDMIEAEYVFGIKHRDWKTGKITGLELSDSKKPSNRNVLIVDDICSRGGTFFHTANKLKECGAKNVYLYVSHCENTIHDGELLNGDLITHIWTTNSIYRRAHDKISVFHLEV